MSGESSAWGQSMQPDSVTNNRKRAMQSNLFEDQSPKSQYAGPTSSPYKYQQPVSNSGYQTASGHGSSNMSQYSNLVKNSEIPQLSPFPEFSMDLGKITESFDLGVKPRTPVNTNPPRKLNFTTGNQMKQMRMELERDFSGFSERMKRLGSSEPLQMETVKFEPIVRKSCYTPPTQYETVAQPEPMQIIHGGNLEYEPEQPVMTMSEDVPGFTTASEFIMPDGTQYTDD